MSFGLQGVADMNLLWTVIDWFRDIGPVSTFLVGFLSLSFLLAFALTMWVVVTVNYDLQRNAKLKSQGGG